MATIANWNGHTFEVSPHLIRGFTDMSIKAGCETTDKNSGKQKYVERKYGEIPEISMTVGLSAQTGVTNVFKEAMEFVEEATEGATAYFYMGSSKLLPGKMMLTNAEVGDIVHMPGKGATWISCDVKLTFKRGSGSSSGEGGSDSNKESVSSGSSSGYFKKSASSEPSYSAPKTVIEEGKQTSQPKKYGLAARLVEVRKATTTTTNTSVRTGPTTGRPSTNVSLTGVARVGVTREAQ